MKSSKSFSQKNPTHENIGHLNQSVLILIRNSNKNIYSMKRTYQTNEVSEKNLLIDIVTYVPTSVGNLMDVHNQFIYRIHNGNLLIQA